MSPHAAAALLRLGPNQSLLLVTTGLLLLYAECNRPGYVLPGAAGLLLVLTGSAALAAHPLRPSALGLLLVAFLTLALPLRLPLLWLPVLTGTLLLAAALTHLSSQPPAPSPALALLCALVLGPITGWLAAVAGKARRAKRTLTPQSSHPERWE